MALTVTASKSKDRTRPLTGEIRHEFEQFLLGNGMTPDPKKGLIVDGSIGRALMDVDGKQKLVGWYQCWFKPYPSGGVEITDTMRTIQWQHGNPITAKSIS